MGLTRLAVKRPLTILMIIVMIVIMGYRAYTMLQVERLPKTDLPVVSISVSYPGASPEDIEAQITKPLEDAVAGISGVDTLSSQASEGSGSVTLQFVQGVDTNQAAIDVERQVAGARRNLPTDAGDPVVNKADINAQPIIQLVLSGPQGQDALYQSAVNDIRPQLESVDGVASVNVSGGRARQIAVDLNPAKMTAYGLSLTAVQSALSTNNTTTPAGSVDKGRLNIPLRAVGAFTNLDDIRNLVISNPATSASSSTTLPGQNPGGMVRLRDIATVQDSYADRTSILRFNGVETVSIGVVKASDANTISVSDGVRAKLAQLNALLPAGAQLSVMNDSAVYTRASVEGVQTDLILAILITGLIMLVFLHTIRSTFIVLLAIPTSIIATFLVMWTMGFTLNTMTLMALTLVIGILVDDSIVVLENTERHLKMGKDPKQAALDGRSEIGLAAITITLVDVVVYLPVAFVSGIIGQFFRSYGLTIVAATLFSLAISFTLTPMLASQWLKAEGGEEEPPTGARKVFAILSRPVSWLWKGFTKGWEAGFDALARGYAALVRGALKNVGTQLLVVAVALVALAAGLYLVVGGVVGTEFMPQEDDGQFSVSITMPPGTNLATTDQAAQQVERIIHSNVPETDMVLTSVGGRGGGFGGSNTNSASISVYLIDKNQRQRSVVQITDQLRPRLAVVPDARTSVTLNSAISFGFGFGGGSIQVQFLGPDLDQLTKLANQAEVIMRQVPGVSDVINTDAATSGESQLVVDRQRLSDLGLTSSQVGSSLRTAVSGTQVGNYSQPGQTDVPVIVEMDTATRNNVDQLMQIPLTYNNGNRIALGQVVKTQDAQAPVRLSRTNRELVLNVRANPTGRAAGDVSNDIEAALRQNMVIPSGYTFQFSGGTQQQRSAFADFGGALELSVVLIYMLLVALYQSWMAPLAIMFALPVTIVGAFGGLLLTHRTLNIISLLGVILLTGIVTKNAILIVDFANQRREQGYSRKEALIEAGRLRLRPILMTTAALVCALLPLLFHTGAGSELRAPMAAVVIGGNITSTLLSLVLVPVAYNALDSLAGAVSRAVRKVTGGPKLRAKDTLAGEEEGAPAGGE